MTKAKIFGISIVAILACVALAVWQLKPIQHVSSASSDREFTLECDFAKFKQIMVRKNATKAVVAHGGLSLLRESVDDITLDTSKDDRPLLNAIRGTSKTELSATKTLTVRLDDPHIKNTDLTLRQVADVDTDRMHVETASIGEQQSIKRYATTLTAMPDGSRTRVQLSIEMKIEVSVPKLFVGRADSEVQRSADDAIAEQQQAITSFVIENADKKFIFPNL